MQFEVIQVQCYAGYKSNERLVSFWFRGREYHVAEIIDRWYEGSAHSSMPMLDYFKVKTADGDRYIIRYNRLFDQWSLAIQDDLHGQKNIF
jgi:hypothetical protein